MSVTICAFTNPAVGSPSLIDDTLGEQQSGYNHVIKADGGFWSLSFNIQANSKGVDDWLSDGLGRSIVVYGNAQQVIWEGFVNKVSANLGATTVSSSLFPSVANRVKCTFSTFDYSLGDAVTGITLSTDVANDTASQAKYGIIERNLTSGGSTLQSAEANRDLWLIENAYPLWPPNVSIGNSSISLSIECWGYVRWLSAYIFSDATSTGTINASDRIKEILTAQLNPIISSDYGKIETNTLQVPARENKNRDAYSIIMQNITPSGSIDNQRMTFGVYEDRKAFYNTIPNSIAYERQEADPSQQVYIYGTNSLVYPHDIRPCKWLFSAGLEVGRSFVDKRQDPRYLFIEEVSVSASNSGLWDVTLTGSRQDTLKVVLAQQGLSGLGG